MNQHPNSFHERYLPGLLQLATAEVGITHGIRSDDVILEPESCRSWLEAGSYDETLWSELLDGRIISHDIRATIIAAMSEQPRSLLILKVNLRLLDELDGLIPPMDDISDRSLSKTAWHTPALQGRIAIR